MIESESVLDEVQKLTPTSGTPAAPTGGTWTLTLLGHTTAAIAWNANAAAIKAAIDTALLPSTNTITVTPATGTINTTAMTLTFPSTYGNVAEVFVNNASLTVSGARIDPSTVTDGSSGAWVGLSEEERTHDGLWVTAYGGAANS